ncbi:YeeE/YedE family protein [Pleurostoma richardsiae]|uniref:YeeE/YedE family protein n=1 Tax=Pleurostoma richardsiae TaxID=41990 RepID=A0AA38RR23_9PEZI|nr:YeeE/YedE family protein [Pleurostoma richardsiae]
MNTLITGAAFGAALTASGVYQPSVILSQLSFENWHMIQAFLTATASSAILVTVFQRLGYVQFKPRGYSTLGLFASYDANIVGGLLLGAGMALSGSCPGTVLPQTALGVTSGYYTLGGSIAGGILWSTLFRPLLRKTAKQGSTTQDPPKTSVYEALGISRTTALVALETVFTAVIAGTAAYTSVGPEATISPVVGGLLIGAAQLTSIVLRKSLLGISTCYEEVGDWVAWCVTGGKRGARPAASAIILAVGMVAGSWGLVKLDPSIVAPTTVSVSPVKSFVGGVLMVVGSRLAGGCTSGHGISGISLLSVSSLITIGSAFGFGAVLMKFL